MAAAKQTAAAQPGFTSSDKARYLLRPAQKTDQLCRNPKPCSYGDRCIFAHNMEEQRRFRQAYGSGGSAGSQADKQGSDARPGSGDSLAKANYCHPDKYKTMLCWNFQRQGYCIRGIHCTFAHGESELRGGGQRSRDSVTAEFSPAPPPPAAVHVPSSSASVAGGSAVSGSTHSGEAEVEGSMAPTALDEAYALQLQYDEQHRIKEQAQHAQHARQASPPPGERAAGASYAAAAASIGGEVATGVLPPPGLALPRLDSEAAFPALTAATGAPSRAGSLAAGSQPHSRAPSTGACSAEEGEGAGPITACPSEEGTQRAPSSNSSVTTEAEVAAHTAAGSESGAEGGLAGEEQEEVEGLVAAGEEAAEAGAATAGPLRSGSHSSWADEADEEEAEEAQQAEQEAAGAAASGLPVVLPPPPPPPARQPRQQPMVPPAQLLLQALRSSSAASAAAAAAAAPADCGSPLRHVSRQPPAFRQRAASALPSPQPQPRLQPAALVGANGGVDLSVVPHFVCPLTGRPFVDPVVAADGVTYERDVIEFLLYRKNIEVSPVLRGVRLEHNLLAPNTALLCAMGEVAALLASVAAAQ